VPTCAAFSGEVQSEISSFLSGPAGKAGAVLPGCGGGGRKEKRLHGEASLAHRYEVSIPGLQRRSVEFEENRLTCGRTALYYYDITGIAFQADYSRKKRISPVQDYRYRVWTDSAMIDVRFMTAFHVWEEIRQDAISKLEWFSRRLIYPGIVEKLAIRIFQLGDTVRIGDLHIDADGYFKRGFLGFKTKVGWGEQIHTPTLSQGRVEIWRPKRDAAVKLTAISMLEPNAVLLPDLIPACAGIARKFGPA
jgi:hypothetical protein